MLEFLVLGEIPGTQIQYNFYDVILAYAWTLFVLEAYMLLRRWRMNIKPAAQKQPASSKQAAKNNSKAKSTKRKPVVKLPVESLAS